MNLDDQIRRYFGTTNLAEIPAEALDAGIEHMKVDLGLSKDRGDRFALWVLLHSLGSAPDPNVIFDRSADREAAWNLVKLMDGSAGS